MAESSHLRSGVFELDLTTGELRKSGVVIHLPPQPFKILALLASRAGQLVTRKEIQQQVWGDETFVDFEHGVNFAIKRIREALGDNTETPQFIETLPRRGYRFIAPVEAGERGGAPTGAQASGAATAVAALDEPRHSDEGEPAVKAPPYYARPRALALATGGLVALAAILVGLNFAGLRNRLAAAVGARYDLPPPRIESIAVLPLANLSGDPAQEYFVDGMTDSLIAELGQIGSLRVISRTSIMQYKGAKTPLPQIARELNVDAVIEGSVLRSGDRVRVTAQLIGAVPERHLWARSYERDLRDVLALQGEIARTMAEGIKAKIAPNEQARLTRAHTVNPEALELYLKGNDWLGRGDKKKALEFFQHAIEKDPNFARAYLGVAWVYEGLALSVELSSVEAFTKAKTFARKALELDESLAEAHVALADALLRGDWDWAGAERELNLALELNPNSDVAHDSYSRYFRLLGRYQESVAEARRGLEINPLTESSYIILGMAYYFGRQYDEALPQFRKAQQMAPSRLTHVVLGWVYREKGMHKEAVAELLQLPDGSQKWGHLGNAYARAGQRAEAQRLLQKSIEQSKHEVGANEVALVYAGLGEKDRAFEWLEKAYKVHEGDMSFLKVDPPLDPLRSDPRFQDLVRRMNFPP